jgi:hypothetical protein
MKHFHFCLTSLKKGIWSPTRNQWRIGRLLLQVRTTHFPSDVQHTWGWCKNKFNKMKDKYNMEKKKTNITCAPL